LESVADYMGRQQTRPRAIVERFSARLWHLVLDPGARYPIVKANTVRSRSIPRTFLSLASDTGLEALTTTRTRGSGIATFSSLRSCHLGLLLFRAWGTEECGGDTWWTVGVRDCVGGCSAAVRSVLDLFWSMARPRLGIANATAATKCDTAIFSRARRDCAGVRNCVGGPKPSRRIPIPGHGGRLCHGVCLDVSQRSQGRLELAA